MRQCSLNSLTRLIIDGAALSFRSFRIRSTSRAPTKLEEIGLIARIKSQCSLNPCTSSRSNYSASLQIFRQLFNHLSMLYVILSLTPMTLSAKQWLMRNQLESFLCRRLAFYQEHQNKSQRGSYRQAKLQILNTALRWYGIANLIIRTLSHRLNTLNRRYIAEEEAS